MDGRTLILRTCPVLRTALGGQIENGSHTLITQSLIAPSCAQNYMARLVMLALVFGTVYVFKVGAPRAKPQ